MLVICSLVWLYATIFPSFNLNLTNLISAFALYLCLSWKRDHLGSDGQLCTSVHEVCANLLRILEESQILERECCPIFYQRNSSFWGFTIPRKCFSDALCQQHFWCSGSSFGLLCGEHTMFETGRGRCSRNLTHPNTPTHTVAQTYRHTDTQTCRDKCTDTKRHAHTHTHTTRYTLHATRPHAHTPTHTPSHARTPTLARTRTRACACARTCIRTCRATSYSVERKGALFNGRIVCLPPGLPGPIATFTGFFSAGVIFVRIIHTSHIIAKSVFASSWRREGGKTDSTILHVSSVAEVCVDEGPCAAASWGGAILVLSLSQGYQICWKCLKHLK